MWYCGYWSCKHMDEVTLLDVLREELARTERILVSHDVDMLEILQIRSCMVI